MSIKKYIFLQKIIKLLRSLINIIFINYKNNQFMYIFRKKVKFFLLIFGFFIITSCTHLTYQEKSQWKELQNLGIKENDNAVVNPALAGGLNILPGVGNFYLASGSGADSSHWIYGILNLLTWPFSIIWGMPEAALDANTINKKELIYYYTFDKKGKKELLHLKESTGN